MPELPEVETIVRELRRPLGGMRLGALKQNKRGVFLAARGLSARSLEGKRVRDVRRRGKYIIIDLSGGLSLLIHLRMTGRLVFFGHRTQDTGHWTDDKHTHCVFCLSKGRILIFNDTRRFGRINLMRTKDLAAYFKKRLGPEPFEMTTRAFLEKAQGRKTRDKAFLLDQKNIAGVGNIYADESLYRARIHPTSVVSKLSEKQLRALHAAVMKVLKEAIKGQGTTVADFRRSGGETGLFQNKLRVYGHEGYSCRRCRGKIRYMKLGGRGTYYCPKCQAY